MQNLRSNIDEQAHSSALLQEQAESAELLRWTSSDDVAHPVRLWRANAEQAVVLYFHGIEGHGRWFEETAHALNKNGISVYAADRRGAGLSTTPRGHAESWQRLVDDADEMIAEVRRRHIDAPVFIAANCWGAKVALTAAARSHNQILLSGLIMTSPAVFVQVDVPFWTKLSIGFDLLAGSNALFDIPLTPEHFTDVPKYLNYIRRDQLRLTKASSKFFIESLKLTRQCQQASQQLRMPLLILQSGRDTIVDIEKIKLWFESLPSTDKTFSLFNDAAHSLDFDSSMDKYQAMLSNWLSARVGGGKTIS